MRDPDRLSSVNGLVSKRVSWYIVLLCTKERRRRRNITNDTTRRCVDVVRKCVEVKTSRGRCTTGFGDLVEINFSSSLLPANPAVTRTRRGRAGHHRSCCLYGLQEEALISKVPCNMRGASGAGWRQLVSVCCHRRERVRRVSAFRGTRRITLRDRSSRFRRCPVK